MAYKCAILLAALIGMIPSSVTGQSKTLETGAVPSVESEDTATLYAIERTFVTTITASDGHPYRIFVSWPKGSPPEAGWPVLYFLDGADNFAIATETARRLERAKARSGVGGGIIVGIDSGPLARRVFDYTPPSPGYTIPEGAPASGLITGGSEQFLSFLETRVKPFVESRWNIDPRNETIAGHSLGGLLALHALFTRPDIAERYAAASPSLWFGDGLINREQQASQIGGQVASKTVLIAEGNNGDEAALARSLSEQMTANRYNVRFLSLSNQNHGTTMLATMGHIIPLAFRTEN